MKKSSKILVQVLAAMCLSMLSAHSAYATTCAGYPPKVAAYSICRDSRVYACKLDKYGDKIATFSYDCASRGKKCKETTTYWSDRASIDASCVKK